MPEISRFNLQVSVVMFENSGIILSFWGNLLSAMSSKWNRHCLGILAILIVILLCSLSNTFTLKCRDSSMLLKGAFFTPFMHSRCRKSVGSVYLTLLGVCHLPCDYWKRARGTTDVVRSRLEGWKPAGS